MNFGLNVALTMLSLFPAPAGPTDGAAYAASLGRQLGWHREIAIGGGLQLKVVRMGVIERRMNLRALKSHLVERAPGLGRYKRVAIAARDSLAHHRRSYAQHGEDLRVLELLRDYDLSTGPYVDVGANHPTDISNTYLLYRQGYRGIVIEPNLELLRLFEIFRPRDIVLPMGCSDTARVARFSISKTPVLSSLDSQQAGSVWKDAYVAVMPLDEVIATLDPPWIPFLSVDVEGHDASVLRGAMRALERTYLACVEINSKRAEEEVRGLLEQANFSIVERSACNVLATHRESERFGAYRKT